MTAALKLVLKFALGGLLLAFVLSRVPLTQVGAAVGRLTFGMTLLAVVAYFAAHVVNALKLRVLLPTLSVWQAWRFTMIAVLYGTALPGQLAGDAVKALRLARVAGEVGDVTAAVAAVAVDKIIGMFALLLLTALGIGLNTNIFGLPVVSAAAAVTILMPLGLTFALTAPLPSWMGRWGQEFAAWRAVTLSSQTLMQSLALGFVFQALSIATFVILGDELGLTVTPSVWAVIVGLVSIILLLPVTVAGLGLRDGSLLAVLAMLGQPQPVALALSFSLLALNLLGAAVGLVVDLAGRDSGHR